MPSLSPGPRCALTAPFHPYPDKQGGLLSVALSLGFPRAGVTRRLASVEPGLSSRGLHRQRSPGRLTKRVYNNLVWLLRARLVVKPTNLVNEAARISINASCCAGGTPTPLESCHRFSAILATGAAEAKPGCIVSRSVQLFDLSEVAQPDIASSDIPSISRLHPAPSDEARDVVNRSDI